MTGGPSLLHTPVHHVANQGGIYELTNGGSHEPEGLSDVACITVSSTAIGLKSLIQKCSQNDAMTSWMQTMASLQQAVANLQHKLNAALGQLESEQQV